jgi:predicted alpha/beta-hydrolase family hydrolase
MKITVDEAHIVSAILHVPPSAAACCVLAHGAGAGMDHPFMAAVADGLFTRHVATLRYQFPYMERGSKRPDRPPLAHATIRAAIRAAAEHAPDLPLFDGGKSFGARMTSQAQAEMPLPSVRSLIFLGFPLHPRKEPSDGRARHLADVHVPMHFLQGTRDELADMALLGPLIEQLGEGATLASVDQADHTFHVPARSGQTDAQVLDDLLDILATWVETVLGSRTSRSSRRS